MQQQFSNCSGHWCGCSKKGSTGSLWSTDLLIHFFDCGLFFFNHRNIMINKKHALPAGGISALYTSWKDVQLLDSLMFFFLLPVCVPSIACRTSNNPETSLESIGPTVVTNVGNEKEDLQLVTHKHRTQKVLRLCYLCRDWLLVVRNIDI